MIRTLGGDTRRGRVSQPHGVPKTLVCIYAKVIQSPTPLDVKIAHVRGRAEFNGEQKAKELQNNPAAAFVMIVDVAYGDRDTDETGRRFRTEVLSTLKRTEMPGSRKMCVWCGRHQDGKEKNTGTEKRQKQNESRPEKNLQPSGNGGVFP